MTQVTPVRAAAAERLYNEGRELYARAQTATGPERDRLLIDERKKYEEALGAVGISLDALRLPLADRLARGTPPAVALTSYPVPVQNAAYNLARRYHDAAYGAIARPDLTPPMVDAARRGLEVALGVADGLVRGPAGEQIADPMAHIEFASVLTDMVRLRVRQGEVGELVVMQRPAAQGAGFQVVSQNLAALQFARHGLLTAAQVNGSPLPGRGIERTEMYRQLQAVNTELVMATTDASRLIVDAATAATGVESPALTAFRNSALAAMPRNAYGKAWLEWFVQTNRAAFDGSSHPSTMLRYRAQFQHMRAGVEQRMGPVQ